MTLDSGYLTLFYTDTCDKGPLKYETHGSTALHLHGIPACG